MSGENILIVEDDRSIASGLRLNLETEGYQVEVAMDGETAITLFESKPLDLILLDLMLPGLNGLEVLSRVRHKNLDIPVLLLTARDNQADKVEGLDLGADDYITKPFSLPELLARINAALRRVRRRTELDKRGSVPSIGADLINFGAVVIDTGSRRVFRQDEEVPMSAKEFDLLLLLVRAPDRVLSRSQILSAVWGDDYEGTERTVDNFVQRLRTKLEADPENPQFIQTLRGVGYRFTLSV